MPKLQSGDLGEHLAWLAFPESQFMYFQELYRKKTAPRMPQYYAYSSHAIINPREITYDIHRHALEFIDPYLKGYKRLVSPSRSRLPSWGVPGTSCPSGQA